MHISIDEYLEGNQTISRIQKIAIKNDRENQSIKNPKSQLKKRCYDKSKKDASK